jgi:hypothetical protein
MPRLMGDLDSCLPRKAFVGDIWGRDPAPSLIGNLREVMGVTTREGVVCFLFDLRTLVSSMPRAASRFRVRPSLGVTGLICMDLTGLEQVDLVDTGALAPEVRLLVLRAGSSWIGEVSASETRASPFFNVDRGGAFCASLLDQNSIKVPFLGPDLSLVDLTIVKVKEQDAEETRCKRVPRRVRHFQATTVLTTFIG